MKRISKGISKGISNDAIVAGLFALVLLFGACSPAEVAKVCAQDAAVQPAAVVAVEASAPVVAAVAPTAAPVAGVAVVAAQVDTAAVHPAVVAECDKLTAASATSTVPAAH